MFPDLSSMPCRASATCIMCVYGPPLSTLRQDKLELDPLMRAPDVGGVMRHPHRLPRQTCNWLQQASCNDEGEFHVEEEASSHARARMVATTNRRQSTTTQFRTRLQRCTTTALRLGLVANFEKWSVGTDGPTLPRRLALTSFSSPQKKPHRFKLPDLEPRRSCIAGWSESRNDDSGRPRK